MKLSSWIFDIYFKNGVSLGMSSFIDRRNDLSIEEQDMGLYISQNGKSFLARKWQLTSEVREIIKASIQGGFNKLWVENHPKGSSSHYICFSRSHLKPWEFLIGGEAKPPSIKMITVNNTHRKILDDSKVDFHWQNFGGKHLFLPPKIELLKQLMGEISKYPHSNFNIKGKGHNFKKRVIRKTGFQTEKELEDYVFRKLKTHNTSVFRQKKFNTEQYLVPNSIPDIIIEKEKEVFILELKLNAANTADIYQLKRYLNNEQLQETYKTKKIKGILVTGYYDKNTLDEARTHAPDLALYSFHYHGRSIIFSLECGSIDADLGMQT